MLLRCSGICRYTQAWLFEGTVITMVPHCITSGKVA